MKCRKCNRFFGFDHMVGHQVSGRLARRPASYVCPGCGHREVKRMERRIRNTPVDVERRAATM